MVFTPFLLSELVVLHPRTLIGDKKRGFPAMIADRSKMIIYSAKSWKMGRFARLNAALWKKNFEFFFRPSSWPVRAGRFAPPNFDRGLKTSISSDDLPKNGPFCALKFGTLKKKIGFFFLPIFSARASLSFCTPELWSGAKNEYFQRWSPSDQKMIIYQSKVCLKSPSERGWIIMQSVLVCTNVGIWTNEHVRVLLIFL